MCYFVFLNSTLGAQWAHNTSVHLIFPALLLVLRPSSERLITLANKFLNLVNFFMLIKKGR